MALAKTAEKTVGRPRAFDPELALDQALKVFWEKGYEGTSLLDLTTAMRINRPSLYAAFGNKEELFRKVMDRYGERMACMQQALALPTARQVVERLLARTIELQTATEGPRGCLGVQAALSCSENAATVKQELITRRAASETALRERLVRAKAEGDLPASADPAGLARYITTILQGMAIQAASGASGYDLRQVAKIALAGWPG